MMSWRAKHPERENCVFRSRPGFVMRGRKWDTGGKHSPPNAPTTERMEDGSEYADDCAMLYPSRVQLVKYVPLLVSHFGDFGMQVHIGEKGKAVSSKSEVGFFAATYRTYQYIDT